MENYTSLETKTTWIQIRVSEQDKKKLVEFSSDKGGLSNWMLNTALKQVESKKNI